MDSHLRAAAAAPRPTLLVVDDQPINIRVLYQTFAADHQVLMATDGVQALELCRKRLPDLVLLDVVMAGMDGHEVCRRLKADPLTCDIPVIFITAQDEPAMETFGLELGAVDFIAKPVNPAVVRARVKTHLGFARASSLLAATLQSTAEGILVTDLSGVVSHMNATFEQIWNLPPSLCAIGQPQEPIFEFMAAQTLQPERYARELAEVMRRADPLGRFDAIELKGDLHLERHIRPVRINATLGGHLLSFRDATDRHRAALQLGQLNASLELRIRERTLELENALARADAANRAKGEFLSNMSHEIRTPINGVIGMAHLALKADPSPRQRDCLQKIQVSGRHLLDIVNSILDWSKIDAGKLSLEDAALDLGALLQGVVAQVAPAAGAKGLALAIEIDPALAGLGLRGDALRLRQILLNYLGNAVKFSEHGEVRVQARVAGGDHAAGAQVRVRFEVSDQGIGLSEAQIAQLFQSFHQADASITRRWGGTGLGLAISKQLAALMGGEVGVSSQPGVGSCFWFTARLGLTQDLLQAGDPAAEAAPLARQAAAAVSLAGARILVVEDNLINQEVARDLLIDAGASVAVAGNGQEAVERMRAECFDCVLMDMQMPVMDGLQATRLLRAQPLTARVPVIAATANASPSDRERCLQAGMNDFIGKPFEPEALLATLLRWLPACRAAVASIPPGATATVMATPAAPEHAGGRPVPARAAQVVEPIDLAVLSRNVAGNPERIRRYATMFADAIPETLAELESTLAQADVGRLASLAHRLKASARMVGAMGFASMCQSLEDLAPGGTLEQARAIAGAMPGELIQVSQGIERALA